MAAVRFLVPGSILYLWERRRGAASPTMVQWRSAAIIGGMLLLVGNGGVTWAEQVIPSGVTALLISTSPFWFVLLDWILFGSGRPTGRVVTGLGIGLVGVVVLIGPDRILTGGGFPLSGILVLFLATVSWAAGSLYSRKAALPASPMLAGGMMLLLLSVAVGEPMRLDPSVVALKSVLALAYLSLFGSLVAFTAYVWLLRVSTAARVSTYAFVNPVIAVFLGWTLGGEEFTARIGIAAMVIVAGVVLIVARPPRVS
jgi:drug/metabolite transporter (DMT)-like permease